MKALLNRHQFIPIIPDYVSSRSLAANTAESVTIPSFAKLALFTPAPRINDFFVKLNAIATIPADLDDGSASFANPVLLELDVSGTGNYLSLITNNAGTTIVTVAFYKDIYV